MSLHRNRVQMTVSAVDGVTGELTLGSATTGYQSFSSAYGADATVDILITENNTWEVDRNCAYDNTNGKVTRGTLEASSSGSAVTFTSAAIVSVIATAATGNNWGLNEIQASPTGAGVTGVVGTMHILDISGLSADQDFTLPATCAVGDRVGVFLKVGDADYELLLKPDAADTINGGSAGAEWSRLFITGECVIFRCITANADWIVEYDGRIPQAGSMALTTSCDGETASTVTLPTSASTPGAWTLEFSVGITYTAGSGRFTVRRDGNYSIMMQGRNLDNASGTFQIRILKNGASLSIGTTTISSSRDTTFCNFTENCASGDYIQLAYLTGSGGAGLYGAERATTFSLSEVLP